MGTDPPGFHRVELDEPTIVGLREWWRMSHDLPVESNRVANPLWEQLGRYDPQMLHLSPFADEAWIGDLLETAPLPGNAAQWKRAQGPGILQEHRLRRVVAEEVLECLRQPALQLAPGAAEGASEPMLL